MDQHINFLGIQMNCTPDALINAKRICTALDDNPDVDYAITPECALTGYVQTWEKDAEQALELVKEACKRNKTSIFLGSIWKFDLPFPENTAIVINSKGEIVDHVSKCLLIQYDMNIGLGPSPEPKLIALPEHPEIMAGIMICNDFWGSPMMNAPTVPTVLANMGANIFIHLTNGDRNIGKTHDKVYWDWHTAWLQMMSRYHMLPIISVDNACALNGQPYAGRTSSPSGAWILGRPLLEDLPHSGEVDFTVGIDIRHLTVNPYENPYINSQLEL